MFAALGRTVVAHPWRVIALWVLAAVAIVGLAPHLSTTTDEASFLPAHYQSVQAADLQKAAFPQAAPPAALVVFARADHAPLTAPDRAAVAADAAALAARHIPTISAIVAGAPSPNGKVQPVAVEMPHATGQLSDAQVAAVRDLRAAVDQVVAGSDLRAGVTGSAAQYVDQQQAGKRANAIVGAATILLILVLLLVIFRSPVIALLPVIAIALVSQVATGLIASISRAFGLQVDATVTSMLIVVLFGVGTDYILFLLFRYRERLRAGDEPKQALVGAVTRVGPAIATAAGAVIIAFLALTLSSLSLFRSLGPALAIAVATTLVAGLTLVPAVVALLGPRIFWPSRSWRSEPESARFARLGTLAGRHPGRVALGAGGVLLVLAAVALGFHPTFDLNNGSSASSASARWSAVLETGLPAGALDPTDVYVQSTSGAPLDTAALAGYRQRLAAVPGVAQVAAPVTATGGTVADFRVVLHAAGQSDAAMAAVRGPLQQVADAPPPGTRALVGGITSVYVDLQAAMNRDYAVVFPVAAVLILLILALLLRSLVAPWYLMGAVGLGFGATLGAAVGVFQDAASQPGLTFILPIVMYLFVVALGTDYNILMVSRLREEAAGGRDPAQATALAVRHAGPTVGAAGLILAGTFASLILAGGTTLEQMGFAISFGIAIAAFVMALFLTPSLTALVGERAWWPGHGRRPPAGGAGTHGEGEPGAASKPLAGLPG